MRLLASALAVLLLAPAALAQRDVPGDETGGGFFADDVRLPVSAEAQGLSGAGRFDRGADPLRALQNPALLADLDGLSLAGALTPDLQSTGVVGLEGGAIGLPILRPTAERPLAIVLGAATTRFDYDVDGARATLLDDRASTVALGVGWAGGVPVRAGVGVRTLTRGGALFTGGAMGTETSFRSRASVLDLGADVTLPLSDWLRPAPATGPRLAFDVTVGAAFRGTVLTRSSVATREGQSLDGGVPLDPVRSLVLGTSARLGLDVGPAGRALRAVEVAGLADVVTNEFDATQTFLGARVTLFEALALRLGTARLSGGYETPTAVGLGVSGGGLLRALGLFSDNARLAALGRRFDLRYDLASQPSEFQVTTVDDPPRGDWQTHTLRLRVRP